jgi:hypothetical protein
MLVIHWAKHNATGSILKNGLIPQTLCPKLRRGVFVYPFSYNPTVMSFWRRLLKTERQRNGNYNGFVFRLLPSDFPLEAGDFAVTGAGFDQCRFNTLKELAERCGVFWRGREDSEAYRKANPNSDVFELYGGFEIIISRRIEPSRIIRVLRDRPPRKVRRAKVKAKACCLERGEE